MNEDSLYLIFTQLTYPYFDRETFDTMIQLNSTFRDYFILSIRKLSLTTPAQKSMDKRLNGFMKMLSGGSLVKEDRIVLDATQFDLTVYDRITYLDLSYCEIDDSFGEGLSLLSNVRVFVAFHCDFGVGILQGVAAFERLEVFRFGWHKREIGYEGFSGLGGLSQLRIVEVNHEVPLWVSYLMGGKLETLVLKHTVVSEEVFGCLAKFPKLRELDLSCSTFEPLIHTLMLDTLTLEGDFIQSLTSVATCTTLTELNLSSNMLDLSHIRQLLPLKNTLTTLNIKSVPLHSASNKTDLILLLEHFTHLTH
eukprot:TRINITY_DN4563_c0_g1_i1.p1 TRINITY_DN4563_c0_g1~~TRINITY_DN4563_c0_g1_i1.p1  ORF type:complete len:308 (-),score=37.49 TRINITY_DN4563_c0_g1_i1:90-1013(-)